MASIKRRNVISFIPLLKKELWLLTHKVIVPGNLTGHHEEAQEPIRQQHLHSLIVGRQVAFGVVALVRVLSAPLVAAGRQLVRCERARARGEAERQT